MSWLKAIGIGLDLADAYIAEQNSKKLKELQMQGAAVALIEALIKELRNQIFNFKQTAEAILVNESETPVIAAGAMKLLERRLLESGITPEVFQEITDKEYTATVIRLIRENSNRMFHRLSKEEQAEINHVASVASRLQDYEFYVENYQKGKELQKATEVIQTYKNRQGCLPIVGLILYIYPGIAFPFLFAVMLGGRSDAGQSFVGFIGLGLWTWGLIGILKWKNGSGYKDANNVIKKHGEDFNLDYFNSLEKELGDVQEIKKRRNEARRIAGNFFGESSLFQISPYNLEEDSSLEQPSSITIEEGATVETLAQVVLAKDDVWSAEHITFESNVSLGVEEDGVLPQSIDRTNPTLPENQNAVSNFDFEKIKNSVTEKLSAGFGKLSNLFSSLIEKLKVIKISLPNLGNNKKQIIWGGAIISVFVIALIVIGTTKKLTPVPTQDNRAIFTQAFETAFAALSTAPVQATSTILPTATGSIEETNINKTPGWEIVQTTTGTTFNDIFFIDENNGWAVGDAFLQSDIKIIHTTDGGKNWTEQNSNTNVDLESIFFVNPNNGYSAGGNFLTTGKSRGAIIKTQDGGENWSEIFTSNYVIKTIIFIDELFGVAAGEDFKEGNGGNGNTYILITRNGGENWIESNVSGISEGIQDIFFISQDIGWAVGREGSIIVTKDGGKSWEKQSSTTNAWLKSVYFIDENTGWIAGNCIAPMECQTNTGATGVVLRTTNGGNTWQVQEIIGGYDFGSIMFINNNEGWVSGFGMFQTHDGGNSWQAVKAVTPLEEPNGGWLPSIYFLNDSHGWASGISGTIWRFVPLLVNDVQSTQDPVSVTQSLPPQITDNKNVPMSLIPEGEFSMGDMIDDAMAECKTHLNDCQQNWFENSSPSHIIHLDSYYIDTYEVTNSHYKACVDAGICTPPKSNSSYTRSNYYGNPQYNDYPVIYVDLGMAKNYCRWRGGYLPSEAQWEKAARGTDGRTYPWGENLDCNSANYLGCVGDTMSVGRYTNNISPYGLYDMAGNVSEWVADWFSENYYQESPSSNPLGPNNGHSGIIRGGSWFGIELYTDTSIRVALDATYSDNFIGFRCASDIDSATNNPSLLSSPTPIPVINTPTPITCSNFISQLQPNVEAKVITDAINMREKPGTNQAVVEIIYNSDKVQITSEPPICGDGYLWWKVKAVKSGITGWVVEGTNGERWLLP